MIFYYYQRLLRLQKCFVRHLYLSDVNRKYSLIKFKLQLILIQLINSTCCFIRALAVRLITSPRNEE